jgi:hypothetical protein
MLAVDGEIDRQVIVQAATRVQYRIADQLARDQHCIAHNPPDPSELPDPLARRGRRVIVAAQVQAKLCLDIGFGRPS